MGFLSRLFGKDDSPDARTRKLLSEVAALSARSKLQTPKQCQDFCLDILVDAANRIDETPVFPLANALFLFIQGALRREAFVYTPPENPDLDALTLSESLIFREYLTRVKETLTHEEQRLLLWKETMTDIVSMLLERLPPECFTDTDETADYMPLNPEVPLYALLPDLPEILDSAIRHFVGDAVTECALFFDIALQIDRLLAVASGVPLEKRLSTDKVGVLPSKSKLTGNGLLDAYMRHTGVDTVFRVGIPYRVPEAVRFEHTHIVAGTGHGKTQLLQLLIGSDLERAGREKRSLVVFDSHGDMLKTLMQSSYFSSSEIRERFIYIDPSERVRPVGLNLFQSVHIDDLDERAQEGYLTHSLELYEYFFDGLLGQELTARQGLLFRYLGLLLSRIKESSLHTLRDILDGTHDIADTLPLLPNHARAFFETKWKERSFQETKKQLSTRLWGVLAHPGLSRIFSAPRNTVNFASSLQNGSIIFINTGIEHLGEEGSAMYSRLLMALIGRALLTRGSLRSEDRTPTFVYVDECEPVVDETFVRLLTAIRKYKGALTFAHQNLDQLDAKTRAGVLANTSIKLVGGITHKDALVLAPEMHTDTDFLTTQTKGKQETHFALFAKHITQSAISLPVRFGVIEREASRSEHELESLLVASRTRFGYTYEEPTYTRTQEKRRAPDTETKADAPPVKESHIREEKPTPPQEFFETLPQPNYRDEGGGGIKHKHLAHLTRENGESRGFRVVLEEVSEDGKARVDAVLTRDALRIAFEISVTTARDHELQNVEKCLSYSFSHVVLLTSHERRRKSLQSFITDALPLESRGKVFFLIPEDIPGFLDGLVQVPHQPTEKTVKGIKVRTKVRDVTPEDALIRRRALARVVAGAVQ